MPSRVVQILKSYVRSSLDTIFVDEDSKTKYPLVTNPRGDLSIAQALPYKAEMARMRNSYMVRAAAAVSPLAAAMPTTGANLSMSNNEANDGKSYVIESIFFEQAAAAPAATPVGFAVMINPPRPTAVAATLVAKGLAGNAYRGKGSFAVATTVVNDGWFPVGNSLVTTYDGSQYLVNVDGLFIIPPGAKFSVVYLANTVTGITGFVGVKWHEIQLPMVDR